MTTIQVERIRNALISIAPEVFAKHPVLFAYIYGSYATGIVHHFSDLDIGIYVDEIPDKGYLELELSLSLEVDAKTEVGIVSEVRTINNLPLMMIGEIITEGILIYSKNDSVRVEFETTVRKAYFDFLPFFHKYQRTYVDSAL